MGSIIASIIGWIVAKLLGRRKEIELQEKYMEARRRNVELSGENAAIRTRVELEKEERKKIEEWDNATTEDRWDILGDDFDGTD